MQQNKRESDHTSSLRKVQTTTSKKKKCGSERKRITKKGHLFIMKESIRVREEFEAAFVGKFGNTWPARDVSIPEFEEQQFGSVREPSQDKWCLLSKTEASSLSDRVVSIALFDGDKMLFACTGIVLPRGASRMDLTRFLTSTHLVTVFDEMRNREDKLRVAVRLPNKKIVPGFLELYDEYIAIVTSLGIPSVSPLDMYQKTVTPDAPMMVAAGRAYKSCSLMGTTGVQTDAPVENIYKDLSACTCQITEAGLGGPLMDPSGNFVGVNIFIHGDKEKDRKALFLPQMLLRQRLEKYKILTPKKRCAGIITPYCPSLSMSTTRNISQGSYEPPPGAKRIIPSGFLNTWKWLQFMGYPEPPPLMLELNGRLVRKYDDVFGCLHAWEGYKLGIPPAREKNAWHRLDKKIVATISRSVVSLVSSFKGKDRRFLTCTGFIIRCPISKGRTRNIIVTSASLFRTSDSTDIVEDMMIEVLLPPNQRLNGTLGPYHSEHIIAIVNVKGLCNVCSVDDIQDLLLHSPTDAVSCLPRTVVAIGRDPEGVLCASMGEPVPRGNDMDKLSFDYMLSTCKIKTVGIGGPLINLDNGRLVGMNFYDGTPGRTPYLPYPYNCDVLRLALARGTSHVLRLDSSNENNRNRWPVPKPYWYHGVLEVDRSDPIPMRGRILQ